MILEIYIHRYTDKDASLFPLKKIQNKANERSSYLFNIFLLTITYFFICFFFNRQLQNVFDHSLWDFASRKWVLSVEKHQAHTYIKFEYNSRLAHFLNWSNFLTHILGAQTGSQSPKCYCYGPECVCIFPCEIFFVYPLIFVVSYSNHSGYWRQEREVGSLWNTRLVIIIYLDIPSSRWNGKWCKILEFCRATQVLILFLLLFSPLFIPLLDNFIVRKL